MLRSLAHRLKHVLGWQPGSVVSVRIFSNRNEADDWLGFQCDECGDISGLTRAFGPEWMEAKGEPFRNPRVYH